MNKSIIFATLPVAFITLSAPTFAQTEIFNLQENSYLATEYSHVLEEAIQVSIFRESETGRHTLVQDGNCKFDAYGEISTGCTRMAFPEMDVELHQIAEERVYAFHNAETEESVYKVRKLISVVYLDEAVSPWYKKYRLVQETLELDGSVSYFLLIMNDEERVRSRYPISFYIRTL